MPEGPPAGAGHPTGRAGTLVAAGVGRAMKNNPPWLVALVLAASIAFGALFGRPLAHRIPRRHHYLVYAAGAVLILIGARPRRR